jgi:virginiamycin B lyase
VEGQGKDLVESRCQTCHDLGRIVGSRMNLDQWTTTVGEMQGNMQDAHFPPNLSLTNPQAATVAAYLAKAYGPVSLDDTARLPYHLLQGEERDYRAVTFLVQPHDSEPHNFSIAPDGVAWAAARGPDASKHGFLVRFDPRTLITTYWYAPAGSGKAGLAAGGNGRLLGNPQIDSHGILWTTDAPNHRWLSFDTHTQKWTIYPVPAGRPAQSNWMAFAANGWVWATDEVNGIYALDPKTREWHFYKSHIPKKTGSYGIAVAKDGTVWFAEDGVDEMGHVYPDTGKEEDLPIPLKGMGKLYPRRLAADSHDNIWVGLWQVGKLLKIDSKTKKMTFYTPPTKVPGCYNVSIDLKRDIIWFGEQEADKIGRFDPKTNTWLEFPLPYAQSDNRTIEMDPTDPNVVFFSGNTSDLFGFIEYQPH